MDKLKELEERIESVEGALAAPEVIVIRGCSVCGTDTAQLPIAIYTPKESAVQIFIRRTFKIRHYMDIDNIASGYYCLRCHGIFKPTLADKKVG